MIEGFKIVYFKHLIFCVYEIHTQTTVCKEKTRIDVNTLNKRSYRCGTFKSYTFL